MNKPVAMNIGIREEDRKKIADGLSRLLASTYTLYIKTHNFHWNVTGPLFGTLHPLFEQQYNELALAVDTIAERIRALGFYAPGSLHEFSALSEILETVLEPKKRPCAEEMVRQLVQDHETIIRLAREIFPTDVTQDEVTADLLTQRMQVHEKTSWMLRSLLTS